MNKGEKVMAEPMVTIKKGNVEVKAPKSELVEVSETHDGIAFNFKKGLQVYQTEQFMPTHIKQLIVNSFNTFSGNNLIIDLENAKRPVMIDNT
jgi:hypothetical protein